MRKYRQSVFKLNYKIKKNAARPKMAGCSPAIPATAAARVAAASAALKAEEASPGAKPRPASQAFWAISRLGNAMPLTSTSSSASGGRGHTCLAVSGTLSAMTVKYRAAGTIHQTRESTVSAHGCKAASCFLYCKGGGRGRPGWPSHGPAMPP